MENEVKGLTEKYLPLALVGKLFGELKKQIEAERESTHSRRPIRENAEILAKQIVRVVEEPEPIYRENPVAGKDG